MKTTKEIEKIINIIKEFEAITEHLDMFQNMDSLSSIDIKIKSNRSFNLCKTMFYNELDKLKEELKDAVLEDK